jgi:hypothetical protein
VPSALRVAEPILIKEDLGFLPQIAGVGDASFSMFKPLHRLEWRRALQVLLSSPFTLLPSSSLASRLP